MDNETAIFLDKTRFPFVEVIVTGRPSVTELLQITAQLEQLCGRGLFTLQWTLRRTCPRISEGERELYLHWYRDNREFIDSKILAVGVVLARPVHRAAFIGFSWLAKTGPLFRGFLGEAEAAEFLDGVLRSHRLQTSREDSDERTPTPISMH